MRTLPGDPARSEGSASRPRARASKFSFPYFLERAAPVSGAQALMDYDARSGESNGNGDDFVLGVRVPVTSLCPCSKAISDYGAHNQRGYITIEVRSAGRRETGTRLHLDRGTRRGRRAVGLGPVYPLLKRADERHVTMQAYDNPVFVEDMVRNVALRLQADRGCAGSGSTPSTTRASTTTVPSRRSSGRRSSWRASALRVLVITSCTGEKGRRVAEGAQLADFRKGAAHVRKREAEIADLLRSAEELYTGQQHVRLMRGVAAFRAAHPTNGKGPALDLRILSAGYGIVPGSPEARPLRGDVSGHGQGRAPKVG